MKKVAIVGVEGSGKTVMLAGLGDLYSHMDDGGYFLSPQNFGTHRYVTGIIKGMREGRWPAATSVETLKSLDWSLKRQEGRSRPEQVCEISFLDFAGEVYRAAFGISDAPSDDVAEQVESLKEYLAGADFVIVLINLRDIIDNVQDDRTEESMWITNKILETALEERDGADAPRAAIVLSQADNYAAILERCGGASGTLAEYLPHVYNEYSWLDIFSAQAVDKTEMDDDGNLVPACDFTTDGLKPIMDWVLKNVVEGEDEDDVDEEDEDEEEYEEEEEDDVGGEEEEDEDEKKTIDWVPRDAEKCKSWDFIRAAAAEIDGCTAFPHVLLGEGNLIDWSLSTESSALLLEVLPFSRDYDVVDDDVEPASEEVSMAFVSKLLRGKAFLAEQASGVPVSLGVFASPATIKAIRSRISEPRYRDKFKDAHLEYLTCANFTIQVKRILDDSQADAWSEHQSSGASLYELAENYYHGQNGVKEDRAKAFELYQKAAEQGHVEAQYSLGYMYAYGECVEKDELKALFWYRKAAAQGHEKAGRMAKGLEGRIGSCMGNGTARLDWRETAEDLKRKTIRLSRDFVISNSGGQGAENKSCVILKDCGSNKIAVIAKLREIFGWGLAKAKNVVDAAPIAIVSNVSKSEADRIGCQMQISGATIVVSHEG